MKHQAILCLLLIAALLLGCTGCAAGSGTPTEPHTPVSPTEPAAPGKTVDLMADVKPAAARSGDKPDPKAAAAATDFSLRLFRAGSQADKNTLLSPLSVLSALAMTANGAKGDTLKQMEQTLGLSRDELTALLGGDGVALTLFTGGK